MVSSGWAYLFSYSCLCFFIWYIRFRERSGWRERTAYASSHHLTWYIIIKLLLTWTHRPSVFVFYTVKWHSSKSSIHRVRDESRKHLDISRSQSWKMGCFRLEDLKKCTRMLNTKSARMSSTLLVFHKVLLFSSRLTWSQLVWRALLHKENWKLKTMWTLTVMQLQLVARAEVAPIVATWEAQ